MSTANVLYLNPGDKTFLGARAIGEGAIAAGDEQIANLQKWPLGSKYFDRTNRIEYTRVADVGVIADWSYSAAGTLLS